MKTTRISTYAALMVSSIVAASSARAAVITIADYSLTPDGGNLTTTFQHTSTGSVLPATNGTIVYVVSTFTFGTVSDAHLQWNFSTSATVANRIGIQVQDTGLVETIGTGDGILQKISPTTNKRSNVNLATDMAGTTITLLAKLYYNSAVSDDLGTRSAALPGGSANNSDDTIMNVWINPTNSDVEGDTSSSAAMINNGDMYAVWNSAGFSYFRQTIQNQNTPITSGDSSITNTTILTGANATFANALALATVPEPSTALLGGFGLLALLRRRR